MTIVGADEPTYGQKVLHFFSHRLQDAGGAVSAGVSRCRSLRVRYDSPLVVNTWAWWPRRSSSAMVSFSSPNTCTHSPKARFNAERIVMRGLFRGDPANKSA